MVAFRMMSMALLVVVASSWWASPVEAASSPRVDHRLVRRSLFDPSCTGVFDRELLGRLNRVCDDCYNVFREPKVATECRSHCFLNPAFIQCLEYIIPEVLHEEYQANVQLVGK
uniref:Crustacean hyperglycemic hormones B n=1 Tax=Metapenaeus ensis TaxID=32278 RepID=CHHB_METEN|nr:RecName: Full=Crustacean hyperglycemic hormones B; AltName: Full=MeCHH-B; Short=CHH-B; Contains: RecName: Full=CHH precursor-related peptide B; Short=CPRP B; Contains: RecName: Full=Crustacean hyperglycemic hormone B; Short=CHH B; Flags: Precursor [Metapenaeus ensis]AAF63028.1 hyperglycemic hormone CHH-B [Metapenaeus ensis]